MVIYVAERRPAIWPELGRAIVAARERQAMNQEELARLAHVSQGYLSHVERGTRRPSSDTLRVIARQLREDYTHLATLARYAEQPAGDDEKDPILRRMRDRFTAWQLGRLELAAANLFHEPEPGSERYQRRTGDDEREEETDRDPDAERQHDRG